MKGFNLIVKIVAFVLIVYVFMQQKEGYFAEMGIKPAETSAPAK